MKISFAKILFVFSAFLVSCSITDSEDEAYSKWSFSGSVVDGANGIGLAGASITWQNSDGDVITDSTNENGFFYIEGIPYGSRVFTFSYKMIDKKDTLLYAPKSMAVSSTNEATHMEGVVASSATVVHLSPLNARLSGQFLITDEFTGNSIPAKKLSLVLIHSDTSYVNLKPESFSTITDSLGKFTFKGLPADTGLLLKVAEYKLDELAYTTANIVLPRLRADFETDLGRRYLSRDTLVKKASVIKSSNVLDEYSKGFQNVSTLAIPYYVFTEALSDKNLSVSVTKDTVIFYVTPKISGDTLFLKHSVPFESETKYTVAITGYGKKSGNRYSLTLSGDSAFTTDRGLYAVTSNTWPSNKNFQATFGIQDTLWVKFSDTLSTNLERIQWNYAKNADRTIYANGHYANATAWVKIDTLFVKMDEGILDSRSPGDSVGMNVTVYSKSELVFKNFTTYTELFVPQSSSSSTTKESSSSAVIDSSSSKEE